MTVGDRGFAILGSAIVVALAIFMGFGAAVIVERNQYIHQVKLSQQKVNSRAHEQLDVTVTRNPDNTIITVSNMGSAPAVFDYLLLKQSDNRVVAGPTKWPDSLVGWWRFSEGSGPTAYDYSGKGNDGTLHGDPEWVDGWAGDGALRLDGNDRMLASESSTLSSALSSAGLTICIRFKLRNTMDGWQNYLIWEVSNDAGNPTLRVEKPNDYRGIYTRWIAETSAEGDRPSDGGFWTRRRNMGVKPNRGMFYTSKADGSHIYEFLNGKLVLQDIQNDEIADMSGPLKFGGHPFDLDEVLIFNRALNPDEISQLSRYNVLIGPIGLNPLESYSVTYPYRIEDDVTVGVYTQLGNVFWGKR